MPLPLDDRLRPEFIEGIAEALLASWDGSRAMMRLHDHRVEGSSPTVTIEIFHSGAYFIRVTGECWDDGPDKTTAELSAEAKAVLLLAAAKAVRKLKGKS